LVERYGQPLLSLCYASTLNPADAEELAQEVFLAAWRSLSGFRGEASFSTWLFALARNACIDRVRRAAVRPQLVADQAEAGAEPLAGAAQATAAAIFSAAARLSVPLRQALLLRDVQGLSYEEIARLQAVPVGTVRSRIAAARAAVVRAVAD
jgi:RNA polymerase sigma-70 factor (ECF subfamily)